MKPGMAHDFFKVERLSGADADGNPIGTKALVYDGSGTYGTPRASDQERATQAGQHLDAVLAIELAPGVIKPGDIVTLRGSKWTVQWVMDVRLHIRVGLAIY